MKHKEFVLFALASLMIIGCSKIAEQAEELPNDVPQPNQPEEPGVEIELPKEKPHEPFTYADYERLKAEQKAWEDQTFPAYRFTAVVWNRGSEPVITEFTAIRKPDSRGIPGYSEYNVSNAIWHREGKLDLDPLYYIIGVIYRTIDNSLIDHSGHYIGKDNLVIASMVRKDAMIEYDPVYHYPTYAQIGGSYIEIRDFWIPEAEVLGDFDDSPEWWTAMHEYLFPPDYCPFPPGTKDVTKNGEPCQP